MIEAGDSQGRFQRIPAAVSAGAADDALLSSLICSERLSSALSFETSDLRYSHEENSLLRHIATGIVNSICL